MREPVILCVSANPGMDRRLRMKSLVVGSINRASSAEGFAGGKAAHVAMAAHALLAKSVWIAFLGGAIGEECVTQMESLGVRVVSMPSSAPTRVNLEIIDDSSQITEILEPGGAPAAGEAQEFLQRCRREIENAGESGLLAISGRLPSGVGADLYVSLIETARANGLPSFIDSSGEALRLSVEAKPQFVKVNRQEAEDMIGKAVQTTPFDCAGSAGLASGRLCARRYARNHRRRRNSYCSGMRRRKLFGDCPRQDRTGYGEIATASNRSAATLTLDQVSRIYLEGSIPGIHCTALS